jgi:hypothetical protein
MSPAGVEVNIRDDPPNGRATARLADVYGLRVIDRIGPGNLSRILTAIFWIGVLVWVPMVFRPDLLRPADFGSDSSNYAAAGERLAAGTTVYSLQPGDRPVPQDNPPEWSGAILSPPPTALPWTLMLPLPDFLRFHLTWALGLGVAATFGLFLIARLRAWMLPLLLIALFPWGVVAWSGNLNALLAPALALVWRLSDGQSSRAAHVAVGVIVGIAAIVKLGPVIILFWLLVQRRGVALIAATVTGLVMVGATAMFGGVSVFADYLRVVLGSAATPSPLSVPGLFAGLGLPSQAGYLALVLITIVGVVALVIWRSRPGATFAIAVLLSVIVTTVVRVETLVVALAALAPWATERFRTSERVRLPGLVPITAGSAVVIVALGLAGSILTGGTRNTTMVLQNVAGRPLVVRFIVPGQYATFGYELDPDETGTAWFDQMGTYRSPIVVMTSDCAVLYDFRADSPVSGWRIGATAAVAAQVGRLADLPYSSACAEALRVHRMGSR